MRIPYSELRKLILKSLQGILVHLQSNGLIFKAMEIDQKSLKLPCPKFLIWCIFQEIISLPGKTPNHLQT